MKPLFIVGAPRSGTTLMRTLMRGFTSVYFPPDEFQVLEGFLLRSEQGATADELVRFTESSGFAEHMKRRGIWPDAACLADAIHGKSPGQAFEALVSTIATCESAQSIQYYGDKTPENVFILDLLKHVWPDVRILNVVRDPRETVLSMQRAWQRSLTRSSVIWRDAATAAQAFVAEHGPERYHQVHFEQLVSEPRATMTGIAAWLGQSYDLHHLENAVTGERWGRAAGVRGVQFRHADWHSSLTRAQVRRIEEICFEPMKRMRYEPVYATQSRTPGSAQLGLQRAFDGVRVVRAYARERGTANALHYKLRQWRMR